MLRERERTRFKAALGACGSPASWGPPVASGEWFWPSRQERKDVRFTPKTGRYVYFRRVTSWGWYGPMGYASANEIWVYETTSNGGGSAITTPFVTAVTLATNAVPRNDFSGWVGFRFQVGNTETIATHLGRWVLSGNTGTHTIKLVQSDGVDVGGGSVTVTASGTAGQYVYAPLSTKVALAANAAYYLVSQEAQGGDRWYNSSDCLLTLSGVATLPGPVWTYNGPPTYYWAASSNASYVPVGMKYWTGTNEPTWVAASERWYVYDGMVVVQERDKNNVPKVSYTRGLDLSGSRQGAGGIGGLLARSEHGTSAPYAISRTDCCHADGNGNLTALHSTNAVLSASYQYDPYGNVMSSDGDLKHANVYRFSSKMFHANSGLYYYGYSFYDPNLQRWLNRDPIEEEGGINLYRFVDNAPLDIIDPDGLQADSVSKAACRPDAAGDIAREHLIDVLKARQRQVMEDAAKKAAEQAAKALKKKIKRAEKLFRTDKDFSDWVHRELKLRLPKAADGRTNRNLTPEELVEAMEYYFGP